jgi:uncharacterized protein
MYTTVDRRPEAAAHRLTGPPRAPATVVSWRFIVLAVAGAFALITAVNIGYRVFRDAKVAIYVNSAHLITPTLIGAGLFFVVTLLGLVTLGRLRPSDLGWQRSRVGAGLLATAGVWLAFQLVELVAALAFGTALRLSPDWTAADRATTVGIFLGVALGVAPGEETFFRGFLLPQIQLKFGHVTATTAVVLAVLVSQLIFGLFHLPNLLMANGGKVDTSAPDIAVQLGLDFLIGVVYAGLYLQTGNLFLVIGIHTLQDAGTSLLATPIDPALVIFMLAVVLLLATFVPARRGGTDGRAAGTGGRSKGTVR